MRGAHGLLGLIQVCSRVYWVWSKCDRVQNLALDANWYASGDWPTIVFGLISSSANEINQGERWHNRTWIGFKNLDSIIIIIIINLWKSKNEREKNFLMCRLYGARLSQACDLMHVGFTCLWETHFIKQAYEILSYQKGMMLNKKIRGNEEYMSK